MTTWIVLPESHENQILLNSDQVHSFVITKNAQHIFKLFVNIQRGGSIEEIELLKSNRENTIKQELNRFFKFKNVGQTSNEDIFIRFSGESITPLPEI